MRGERRRRLNECSIAVYERKLSPRTSGLPTDDGLCGCEVGLKFVSMLWPLLGNGMGWLKVRSGFGFVRADTADNRFERVADGL